MLASKRNTAWKWWQNSCGREFVHFQLATKHQIEVCGLARYMSMCVCCKRINICAGICKHRLNYKCRRRNCLRIRAPLNSLAVVCVFSGVKWKFLLKFIDLCALFLCSICVRNFLQWYFFHQHFHCVTTFVTWNL